MDGFKVGSVVRLKSGGPSMTVYEVESVLLRTCWFNAAADLIRDAFAPDELVLEAVPAQQPMFGALRL